MKEEFGLDKELGDLRYYRSQMEEEPLNSILYKEAEMCYQMISLYMELDKLLTGKAHWDREYIQEKAETVFRCFRTLMEGKIDL
jgi:hypothetical protein